MKKNFSLFYTFDSIEQAQHFLNTSNKSDCFFFKTLDTSALYYANNGLNTIKEVILESIDNYYGSSSSSGDISNYSSFSYFFDINLTPWQSSITVDEASAPT